MLEHKPKIIIICGPTASGKSDVAIKLAKKFDGEIISADSRQIYRGMNIGSGKVEGKWNKENDAFNSEGISHYLIDVAEPNDDFNISHFKLKAEEAIKKILTKGKLPIVCGGTGFWIQAIVNNVILPDVKPNEKLRSILRNKSAEELFTKLQKLDPERAKNIDAKNIARLIRAIEIATELGKVPKLLNVKNETSNVAYEFLQIGIKVPREILNEKIKKRLESRLESGMIAEIESLIKNGVSLEWLEKIGLEYRWISRYLQNKISLEEMKQKLYFDIIHYAKRQMTWFKKDSRINWLESYKEIEKRVKTFIQ